MRNPFVSNPFLSRAERRTILTAISRHFLFEDFFSSARANYIRLNQTSPAIVRCLLKMHAVPRFWNFFFLRERKRKREERSGSFLLVPTNVLSPRKGSETSEKDQEKFLTHSLWTLSNVSFDKQIDEGSHGRFFPVNPGEKRLYIIVRETRPATFTALIIFFARSRCAHFKLAATPANHFAITPVFHLFSSLHSLSLSLFSSSCFLSSSTFPPHGRTYTFLKSKACLHGFNISLAAGESRRRLRPSPSRPHSPLRVFRR